MEGPQSTRSSSGSTGSRGTSENIKKVAVTMTAQQALFMELDQTRPLAAIIQDIADQWKLSNIEDYSLQFSDPSRQHYITERNREEIQNGNVLQLTDSPAKAAQAIMEKLKGDARDEKIEALKTLSIKSGDVTFGLEFIKKNGLNLITSFVVAGHKHFSGDALMYLLKSFVALMEHNMDGWSTIEKNFTKQVAECLSGARATSDGCTQPALEILESVVLYSNQASADLEHYITVDKIFPYMSSSSNDVKQSAIALINAIFIKAPSDKQQLLADFFQSKTFRTVLQTGILSSNSIGPDMAHQLYKLQRLMMNMYGQRMITKLQPTDAAQVTQVNKAIEELRRIAFDFSDMADQNATPRKSAVSKDYKKLGFTNQTNPLADFEVLPGLLALDNMLYFAQVHKEQYIKVVLENSGRANEQDCPFVQASIQLTKILCLFLHIGDAPRENEYISYPMLFSAEKPLEEFFCCCIQLLNRTWKEMRASKDDFEKVLSVVREQISRCLDRPLHADKDKQLNQDTFEKFKAKLAQFAYPELKKIWEAERQKKDEHKASAKPILELREMVRPEIMELIKKHRLSYLEGGSRFPKFEKTNRIKNKYQYWRLAPNHKALHYSDCQETEEPTIEQLPNKVNILDIKDIVIGKSCPHVNKKTNLELLFSIKLDSRTDEEVCHNFQAHNEDEYNIWIDGIDALLNNEMTSKKTKEDMDVLLNMEIKLRLLETEGVTIPKDPPPIPPLPENFNFAYTTA